VSDQVRILAGDRGPGRRRLPLLAIATVLVALLVGLVVARVTAPDHHSTTTMVAPSPAGGAARRDDPRRVSAHPRRRGGRHAQRGRGPRRPARPA
jgi:hypothetical protein